MPDPVPVTQAEAAVLKPCPFCGKPPKTCPDTSYGAATVYCPDVNECYVAPCADADLSEGETLATAIERWNTRVSAPVDEDVVERAVAEVQARFPRWAPTPSMCGFARAVARAAIATSPSTGRVGALEEAIRAVENIKSPFDHHTHTGEDGAFGDALEAAEQSIRTLMEERA